MRPIFGSTWRRAEGQTKTSTPKPSSMANLSHVGTARRAAAVHLAMSKLGSTHLINVHIPGQPRSRFDTARSASSRICDRGARSARRQGRASLSAVLLELADAPDKTVCSNESSGERRLDLGSRRGRGTRGIRTSMMPPIVRIGLAIDGHVRHERGRTRKSSTRTRFGRMLRRASYEGSGLPKGIARRCRWG